MKRVLAFLILLASAPLIAAAPAPDCSKRPSWCLTGYVCQPSVCAAETTAQIDLLSAMLHEAQATRPRRFHADFTCGPGISTALDKDFGLHVFPTPGTCVVGLAIRIGR